MENKKNRNLKRKIKMERSIFNKGLVFGWFLTCFICLFFTYPLSASQDYWPTKGWRFTAPEAQGMDSTKLIQMLEKIRNDRDAIDSITIVRNGYLVTDYYSYPFHKDKKHLIYSCTKSITSALIGIALDKGFIESIGQPVLGFFKDKPIALPGGQKNQMTLEHLLMMSSGMDTQDSYLYKWKGLVRATNSKDWVKYILGRPMAFAPGEHFEYSNGVSYLLGVILERSTNMDGAAFARQYLFGPLGIAEAEWKRDPEGRIMGSGGMQLRPRDMAKFGLLYLNKGRWDGKEIVSRQWVEASTQRHLKAALFNGYGYHWWVDSKECYMAVGFRGQYIFVLPEQDMVVVFTSHLEQGDFYLPKRLLDQYIIPAAVSSSSLVAKPQKKEYLNSLFFKLSQDLIWTSKENGIAKNGKFKRAAFPAFEFQYPETSIKAPLRIPGQVMAMKIPEGLAGSDFSASIVDLPSGITLADAGPKIFTEYLKDHGSDIRVVSNKKITLKDGSTAFRTDIDWQSKSSIKLKTILVSVFKEEKWVFLEWSMVALRDDEPFFTESLNKGASIVESLTLN